jgi:hypothetical protein
MEQPQPENQLVYWDKHRIPVNLTLFFALAVAAFGVYSGPEWILVAAGIGVAGYSWFTNPRRYMIYQDALTLVYGTPRTRVIYFTNISRLEMRQLNTPDRLRVWLTNGRRVVLMARDPEAFHDHLQQAIDEFARLHPEYFALSDVEEDLTEETYLPESEEQGMENREESAEGWEQPAAEEQNPPPRNRPPDFT